MYPPATTVYTYSLKITEIIFVKVSIVPSLLLYPYLTFSLSDSLGLIKTIYQTGKKIPRDGHHQTNLASNVA